MPKKPALINVIREDINETHDFIDTMRNLDRAMDALRDPAASSSERPSTRLRALMRSARRELLYASLIPLKLVLIGVFNVVALFLFFWLLTVI